MTTGHFTRTELFDLLWSKPIRDIAESFGVASPTIKKASIEADIPTPPQGHWARLAAGKSGFPRPRLPLRGFGAPDNVWIATPYWDRYVKIGPNDPIPPAPMFDEPIERVRMRAAKAIGKVTACRDLSRPHRAIGLVLEDEAARAEKLRTSQWPSSWDAPRFTAPLDQRRLRLLNAICLGLAKAGLKTSLWRKDEPIIAIQTGAMHLTLLVQKLIKKGKAADTDTRLSLVAGAVPGQHEVPDAHWDDSSRRKLETRLTEICVDLAVLVEEKYRKSQIDHHEWLNERLAAAIEAARQAKIEADRKERERLEQLERERIDRLIADAEQLRRAQAIRAYVTEANTLHAAHTTDRNPALDRWRAWALAQADRIDPVKNGRFLLAVDDLT